jgi:hypothetical protein
MIKTWVRFNENLEIDDIRKVLYNKLMSVRENLYDFEDLDIITYSILVSGFESSGGVNLHPKGDIDKFIENISYQIKLGLSMNHIRKNRKVFDEDVCIIANIKIPGESTGFGSTVIGKEGIGLFDDILTSVNRINDLGFNVKLDFNASHGEYKPLRILIYTNL